MRSHGIVFSENQFYELGGVPTEQIIRLLSAQQNVAVDVELASRQKEEAFLVHLEKVRPVEPIFTDRLRESRGATDGGCFGIMP